MKISIIFNNTNWSSINEKVQAIKDFYAPLYQFDIDVKHTSFSNIPFKTVDSIGGINNTKGTTTTVDQDWFDEHISILSHDADIIVLYLNSTDDDPPRTSVGIMQGKYSNIVQCCIFGINETDHAYIYDQKTGTEIDQGNCFVIFTCHEISHALYMLEGKSVDNTHAYFYTAQQNKIIEDLKNDRWFILDRIINLYNQLLGLYKQQITVMHTPTQPQENIGNEYTPYPMIYKWAKAIQQVEGWSPTSVSSLHNNPGNLGYTTLTDSWGAIRGKAKTDGGYFCRFPDYTTGFKALCNFLTLGAENELKAFHQARTLEIFSEVYGNTGIQYAQLIAAQLGVPLTTDVGTFLS